MAVSTSMERTARRWPIALAVLAVAAGITTAALEARAQCSASSDCLPPSGCAYTGATVVPYPLGFSIRNLALHNPTACTPPPGLGQAVDSFFDVFVSLDYSSDGGLTWHFAQSPGHAHQRLVWNHQDPTTRYFDTEMLQLDIAGGTLPVGVLLRESPTLASIGQTTIQSGSGVYLINSFFDIFTELSLDGGVSWMPGSPANHETLAQEKPVAARASTWGTVKLIYR